MHCYNTTLLEVLNKHAPMKEKEVVLCPHAPWYTDTVRRAKQERRKAERRWKKTNLTIYRDILKEKQQEANALCEEAKADYYNKKIDETKKNSQELFKLANSLLYRTKDSTLPSHTSEKDLADSFGTYFCQKIEKIREHFPERMRSSAPVDNPSSSTIQPLTSFLEISKKELSKLILHGNSKSCDLDPIPTSLLKQILPVVLPTMHSIVNKSLIEATMPTSLKKAIVKPLIKKSTLNKENYKNFRPVSNLPYVGKLVEKAAIVQIEAHLTRNSLHEPLQSAYTANHSTETALVKVANDILLALDNHQCVYLVLLDLSAAFDTINHDVFLDRLSNDYAVSGGVSDWMKSYLTDRTQQIAINKTLSDQIGLEYGFPQGSCVGPFGFKLYTKPLTEIARKYEINIHLYADDTQLYVSFNLDVSESVLS